MMSSRSRLSVLTVGLFIGFLVYVVINSQLDSSQLRPVFSSRSLMNHAPQQVSTTSNNIDLISNAGLISAIDQLVTSITPSIATATLGSSDLTESRVKQLSDEISKKIADYVVDRLAHSAHCNPCWKHQNATGLPVIYVVTPTYRRPEQVPELTRMAQTLLNVPAIHWIVVEDNNSTTPAIRALLDRYGMPYTHLNAQMPAKYKMSKSKPRGVSNRNAALDWIRKNARSGVVYFADDDNSYDIRLFEEMRYTKKISMWPVGLVTKTGLSSPVVDANGKVVDFFDGWMANRKFPVDMAGFAVSVELLLQKSDVYMPYVPGHEEDGFLKKLNVSPADIEARADKCTKILVWHTQTKSNSAANRTTANSSRYRGTNIHQLQDLLV